MMKPSSFVRHARVFAAYAEPEQGAGRDPNYPRASNCWSRPRLLLELDGVRERSDTLDPHLDDVALAQVALRVA